MNKNPFEILGMTQDLVFALRNRKEMLRKIAAHNRKWLQFVYHPDRMGNSEYSAFINQAVEKIEDDYEIEKAIQQYLQAGEAGKREKYKDRLRDLNDMVRILEEKVTNLELEKERLKQMMADNLLAENLILYALIASWPPQFNFLLPVASTEFQPIQERAYALVMRNEDSADYVRTRERIYLLDGKTRKIGIYKISRVEQYDGYIYGSDEHLALKFREFRKKYCNDFLMGSVFSSDDVRNAGSVFAQNLDKFLRQVRFAPLLVLDKRLLIMSPRHRSGYKEAFWYLTEKLEKIIEIAE